MKRSVKAIILFFVIILFVCCFFGCAKTGLIPNGYYVGVAPGKIFTSLQKAISVSLSVGK